MASIPISWVLLLLAAQLLHTLLLPTFCTHVDGGNLTQVPFICHPDQAKALLQLKESFSFVESTTSLLSWRDGTNCCVWEGVKCDASSGNVTVLDLNNRGLSSDGLHPSLFNLTSIRRLDLSMNNFRGYSSDTLLVNNIPTIGFEKFAMLTHLNLSNSGLQGQIPIGIRKLVNLLSLDVSSSFEYDYIEGTGFFPSFDSCNYLWGSNFDTLLANLSNLRELYLDGVDMSGNENWCTSLTTYVPHLQELSLAYCSLSGPIHESLSLLHSLIVINLQGNHYMPSSPFPNFFMDFVNLTMLQLSDTNLEGWFPTKSFQSSNLRVLGLSANQNLSGYLPYLTNASSLETLRLHGTNFSYGKSMSSRNFKFLKELSLDSKLVSIDFLSSVGMLGSLYQLDLHGLDTLRDKLGSVFSWIGNYKNLTSLAFFACGLSRATPSSFRNLMTLRSLRMFDCNLPSPILSAIGNLVDLMTLEMFRRTTYASLPSSIGNITNLRHIRIIGSWFWGPMPAAIGKLTKMKTIEIVGSEFSGALPYEIGQLKELTLLDLGGCNLSGRIPSSIVNFTRLTKLDLSWNSLSGEIPPTVFTLPLLRDLDLSLNQLSGPIQEFDKVPSHLESVVLSINELSGPIPKSLFEVTSLLHLDVHSNKLIGLVDLTSFWRSRNLVSLHLSNNRLCVMDGEGSSSSANYLSEIVELGLASCNITQFPRSLMRMKKISYLDLSCNKISGDIPKEVWGAWSSNLAYLNLSHNIFTSIPVTSDVLPFTNALDTLDLSFNKFGGQILMPNSSGRFLDYSSNRFSSVFPNFTLYLRYTRYLSMSNNSINGNIPILVCNSTLDVLDLSHNNFSGQIPSCLIDNGQLVVLNLRENDFEGALPSNITAGCALKTLDLHGNKIEGQLSKALCNCTDLEVLDFGFNRIADTFPSWLGMLPKLSVVVLRSNQFYGSIGDIVGNTKSKEYFPSLQIIDLASNNFSGNLRPQWFKHLKSMMAIFNYTGHYISSDNLTVTDVYYQDSVEITYKGSYMLFERILTTLTVIDFSNNRLEGTVPESIGRLVSLHVLNLSHNAFSGKIPAELGSMIALESLDLSCNQLSGEIPQELTNLTFLDVLNMSNNHLVGKIPQSRQFSTFDSSSFGGNAGLCGPPLSELPCGDSPHTPSARLVDRSSPHHVDVVLFLSAGLGFGVGFAAAIVVKWNRVCRWFIATARALRG